MNRRNFIALSVITVATVATGALGAPLFGQTTLQTGLTARARHVFIISFDGGKPAVMKVSKMSQTMALAQAGAVTWQAQTIFPSVTLPSHTSMLTGVGPDKHKILWNDWRPKNGPVKVPTVFQLAKAQGYKTALFAGKKKFQHLNIPGSLHKIVALSAPDYSAKIVASQAAQYIVSDKPNLCFIHFSDSDSAGHSYGWGSPRQIKAFADEDAALKIVCNAINKAGIAGDSVMILSADHGGHAKTHGTSSPEDMTIPWIVWGEDVRPNFQITAPVTTYDSAATALWLLGVPIPANWDGKPVISAFQN